MGIRQGDQQDAIDQTEDGGSGTDAERQRKNRHRREARILGKRANTETKILSDRFEEGEGSRLTMTFLDLLNSAKSEERIAAGFSGRHARAEVVGDVQSKVRGEFFAEVSVETFAADKVPSAKQ